MEQSSLDFRRGRGGQVDKITGDFSDSAPRMMHKALSRAQLRRPTKKRWKVLCIGPGLYDFSQIYFIPSTVLSCYKTHKRKHDNFP